MKIKEVFAKIEDICFKQGIEILSNSMDKYDCYITFKYKNNNNFFNKLYYLREREYVIQFEKSQDHILLTISGKNNLYDDTLEVLDQNETEFLDIKEILSFINKLDETNSIITYYDGITYYYEITNNRYGYIFLYNNFAYDGYRYQYRANNINIFYETMKIVNKNIDIYKTKLTEIDKILDKDIYGKNTYIQELRENYQNKNYSELYIIFKEPSYYVAMKNKNTSELYKYDNGRHLQNMIPELLQIYMNDYKEELQEERQDILNRSFYQCTIDRTHKLFIYDVEDYKLDSYLTYLKGLKKDNNINTYPINKNNSGYVSILILSLGVLIFSIFVSLITLSFLK